VDDCDDAQAVAHRFDPLRVNGTLIPEVMSETEILFRIRTLYPAFDELLAGHELTIIDPAGIQDAAVFYGYMDPEGE
jgi:hypothetical protein